MKQTVTAVLILAIGLASVCAAAQSAADGSLRRQLWQNFNVTWRPDGRHDSQNDIQCPQSTEFFLECSACNLTSQQVFELVKKYVDQCAAVWRQVTSFEMYFDGNNITSLEFVQYAIRDMKNLTYFGLYLSDNAITAQGARYASEMAAYNPRIKDVVIDLSYNLITNASEFAYTFKGKSGMRSLYLDLSFNQLRSVEFVATAFLSLSKLTQFALYLSHNNITDVAPFEGAFWGFNKLDAFVLDLYKNSISQGVLELVQNIENDVAQSRAFCPFELYIDMNPLTDEQKERLEECKTDLETIFQGVECENAHFKFMY